MEKLPPIPTPVSTQWREFRYQYMPVITFVAIVAAVVVMWKNYVVPPMVLAQVEPVTSNVISTQPGVLTALYVERFQRVKKGQEIGVVNVIQTNVLASSLDTIRADLQVMHDRMGADALRAQQNYERERLTFLQERVQLNINKVLLSQYGADFLRASNLWLASKPPLISEQQYDTAKALYEKTKVEVEQTETFLIEKEKVLPLLRSDSSNLLASIENDIKAQQDKFKAESQDIILRAPIDGTVSVISNWPGEGVVAGKPIVIITPEKSDRIIAYVRQPMNLVPKVNDSVMIRRQTFSRKVYEGEVVQVGSQMERIDPSLFVGSTTKIVDMGLPFLIRVKIDKDDKEPLAPGERVDVILNSRSKLAAN